MISKSLQLRALVLSAGAVATFLSYPYLDWDALALASLVPLMWAIETTDRGRAAFSQGLFFGWIVNLGGFYWITGLLRDFAYLPMVVAVPLYALLALQQGLVFGLGAWFAWWLRARLGWSLIGAWVPAFLAAETLVPMIFPWFLGNSQANHTLFVQSADLGGPWLVSALVVVFNAALATVLLQRSAGIAGLARRTSLRVALVVLALNYAYGAAAYHRESAREEGAERIRVGMVQANIGIYSKGEADTLEYNLRLHQRMSAALESEGAALIVWPETAYQVRAYAQVLGEGPRDLDEARRWARASGILHLEATWLPRSDLPLEAAVDDETGLLDRVAAQRGFSLPLLTGVLRSRVLSEEEAQRYPSFGPGPRRLLPYNSALLLDAEGRVLGDVDKIQLMPFGESVPLARTLYRWTGVSVLRFLPAVSDFEPGREVRVLELPREGRPLAARLGMMICYEDILPRFGRRLQPLGPNLLVNLTNDAWFGDTAEPWLHQTLATFRSIEQRTWLLRSVNTGVTGAIDSLGRVRAHTQTWEEATLLVDVPLLEAQRTPYMRWGNVFGWGGVLVMLLAWVLGGRGERSREAGSGSG